MAEVEELVGQQSVAVRGDATIADSSWHNNAAQTPPHPHPLSHDFPLIYFSVTEKNNWFISDQQNIKELFVTYTNSKKWTMVVASCFVIVNW